MMKMLASGNYTRGSGFGRSVFLPRLAMYFPLGSFTLFQLTMAVLDTCKPRTASQDASAGVVAAFWLLVSIACAFLKRDEQQEPNRKRRYYSICGGIRFKTRCNIILHAAISGSGFLALSLCSPEVLHLVTRRYSRPPWLLACQLTTLIGCAVASAFVADHQPGLFNLGRSPSGNLETSCEHISIAAATEGSSATSGNHFRDISGRRLSDHPNPPSASSSPASPPPTPASASPPPMSIQHSQKDFSLSSTQAAALDSQTPSHAGDKPSYPLQSDLAPCKESSSLNRGKGELGNGSVHLRDSTEKDSAMVSSESNSPASWIEYVRTPEGTFRRQEHFLLGRRDSLARGKSASSLSPSSRPRAVVYSGDFRPKNFAVNHPETFEEYMPAVASSTSTAPKTVGESLSPLPPGPECWAALPIRGATPEEKERGEALVSAQKAATIAGLIAKSPPAQETKGKMASSMTGGDQDLRSAARAKGTDKESWPAPVSLGTGPSTIVQGMASSAGLLQPHPLSIEGGSVVSAPAFKPSSLSNKHILPTSDMPSERPPHGAERDIAIDIIIGESDAIMGFSFN